MSTEADRLILANALLFIIGSRGRHFFRHKNKTSYLELDARGRVWFVDSYSGKRVYTHSKYGRWKGFTNGGTLRSLICHLRDWVKHGVDLPGATFGPWPTDYCHGDLWGYGDSMQEIRDAARALGLLL